LPKKATATPHHRLHNATGEGYRPNAPDVFEMVSVMLNPKRIDADTVVSNSRFFDNERVSRLISAYRSLGGVMSGDDLASLMRSSMDQPVSFLARAIVERRIVFFPVGATINVPCFQFEPEAWKTLPAVKVALTELLDVFDDLAIAEWFVRPNCWIQYRVPCLLVRHDVVAVRDAARADRYVATGW
jgi:hypothetical protein